MQGSLGAVEQQLGVDVGVGDAESELRPLVADRSKLDVVGARSRRLGVDSPNYHHHPGIEWYRCHRYAVVVYWGSRGHWCQLAF